MNRQSLYQHLMTTFAPRHDPAIQLRFAQRDVQEAECSLQQIEEALESFDREAIYRTGWYEGGEQYWTKCSTRETSKCYFVSRRGDRDRRFRREDVEVDDIFSRWYEGYHLGRFIYHTLLDERRKRGEYLERCRQNVRLIEQHIAEGRPPVGLWEPIVTDVVDRLMPTGGPSDEKADWKKEGF